MKHYRAYKFRLYPNKPQQIFLNQVFGDVRFVWNNLVANFNLYGTEEFKEKLSEKEIKEQYDFLKNSISYALQQKRMDFDSTKSQFFNKTRKKKLGRMKFKKKGVCNDSFRLPGQCLTNPFDFDNNTFKIPKLGKVKIVFDRQPKGDLKSATISRDKTNSYYISCLIEEEIEPKELTNNVVGLDLGLKELLTCSNGDVVQNPKWFRKSQSKLAKAQRHLSRKQKGSNRHKKQKLKVARIHKQIANQRSWFIHNITSAIIENFDIVCLEDLNVAGMKSMFGKSISDVSFSMLVNQLEYKAKWYGKQTIKIDRFYPSSKTCSCCGNVKSDLTLKDRTYICSECETEIDRDLNASINILKQGLKDLSAEITDYKRGEEIRLGEYNTHLASSMKRLEVI